MCCTPVYGHLFPVRAIAKHFIARGYDITFVSGTHYQKEFEEIGCTYVPLEGYADWWEGELNERWPGRTKLAGPEQLASDFENCFVKTIPGQYEALQRTMKLIRDKHPHRPVIQISEGLFLGSLPTTHGARGLRPTGSMGIGVIPMSLSSIDTAPFGSGLLPDTTPEGQEKNKAMTAEIRQTFFSKGQQTWLKIFEGLGARRPDAMFLDAIFTFPDRFLQMCTPSAEYPRNDAPSSVRFAGGLPKGHRDPMRDPPAWWTEVIKNNGKDIIFVSQGTLALNYSDLVVPTMKGLETRENTLVVVALGKRGATLPVGTHIPANARVADFIPFDELLPHCAVFVTNGGYGAFQHGISNGTPLVCAGAGEDKPETSARAEWCGIGVNLRTGTPTPEAIRGAVDEIVSNPRYKMRPKELEAEMAMFDPMSVLESNIEELAAGKHLT